MRHFYQYRSYNDITPVVHFYCFHLLVSIIRSSCWCPLFSHCGSSVSSSILPFLSLPSEDDVMHEAMCEMPVLSPQVMFDGRPSHTSSWKDDTGMRRVFQTWDTFEIFDQLRAVSSKAEINVSNGCITSLHTKCCSVHIYRFCRHAAMYNFTPLVNCGALDCCLK